MNDSPRSIYSQFSMRPGKIYARMNEEMNKKYEKEKRKSAPRQLSRVNEIPAAYLPFLDFAVPWQTKLRQWVDRWYA